MISHESRIYNGYKDTQTRNRKKIKESLEYITRQDQLRDFINYLDNSKGNFMYIERVAERIKEMSGEGITSVREYHSQARKKLNYYLNKDDN